MTPEETHQAARITYRATVLGGPEAELSFVADPTRATAADAWALLSAVYGLVDPQTLEIEVRRTVT